MKAICPRCNSIRENLDRDEAAQIVEDHNGRMHDKGTAVTRPDGMDVDELNSLMDHAKEVCHPQQYEEFVDTVINEYRNFGHLDE